MTTLQQWIAANYDELVKDFAGHWVLIKDERVIFSDKSFRVVYNQAEKLQLKTEECIIEFIDSGDAVFYEVAFSHSED